MASIFLSYSRHDGETVREIVASLEQHGLNIWWDGDIPPGENYRDFIDRKLSEAPAICVVWSKSSVASRWVAEEAEEGVKRKNLVPIAIEDCELPRGFRAFQCAKLISGSPEEEYQEEFDKLLLQLKTAVGGHVSAPAVAAETKLDLSAFAPKSAKIQNMRMAIAVTAIAVVLAFYDMILEPGNVPASRFRLMVMLPALMALTGLLYLSHKPWQVAAATVAFIWSTVALAVFQTRLLGPEWFGPDRLGIALNEATILAGGGVAFVHTNLTRIISLFGGTALFVILMEIAVGPSGEYYATALPHLILIPAFVCLGTYMRDRRYR